MDGNGMSSGSMATNVSGITEDPPEADMEEMGERRALLRAVFEARFAYMQGLSNEWSKQLPESDWRFRLLHKALYSTWADLRQLREAEEVMS